MAIHDRFGQLQVETKDTLPLAASVPQIAGPAVPEADAPEFNFKGQKVRVVMLEGEPWFFSKDVCMVMFDPDYIQRSGPANYLQKLDHTEKRTVPAAEMTSIHRMDVKRATSSISESGLYKLIMRSDKPEAKAFQDWVTREVLPSIRKTGRYEVQGQQATPEARAVMPYGGRSVHCEGRKPMCQGST